MYNLILTTSFILTFASRAGREYRCIQTGDKVRETRIEGYRNAYAVGGINAARLYLKNLKNQHPGPKTRKKHRGAYARKQ